MLKFKIVVPSQNGHDTTVLEGVEPMIAWVEGINWDDFGAGRGQLIAVEDEVVKTKSAFMDEINKIVQLAEAGQFPRDTVDVRVMRQMAGG